MPRQKSYKTVQKERIKYLKDAISGENIYAYLDVDSLVEYIKEAAGNLRYDPFCRADSYLDEKIIKLAAEMLHDKVSNARHEGADEERNRME